jgi:hypothetical protein
MDRSIRVTAARDLRREVVFTLIAMATILVAGWRLTEFLGQIYEQNVQQEASGDIDLLASRLREETSAVDGMVKALAGSPSILPLLTGGSASENDVAKSVLDLDVGASAASVGSILNRNAKLVASSSNRDAASPATAADRSDPLTSGQAGKKFGVVPRRRLGGRKGHPPHRRGGRFWQAGCAFETG